MADDHYVPRFYLRGFTPGFNLAPGTPQQGKNSLFLFQKATGRCRRRRVEGIAQAPGYDDFVDAHGMPASLDRIYRLEENALAPELAEAWS